MHALSVISLRKVMAVVAAILIVLAWKTREAHAWIEQARLIPDVSVGAQSVAISGPHAVVGGDTGLLHFDPGAAVIFTFEQGEWRQSETLASNEQCGLEGCSFGASVALENDRLVVGAPFLGKTFVFERSMDEWRPTATLSPTGGGSLSGFGEDVDVQGDRVAVGAPGDDSVYVFDLVDDVWSPTSELQPAVTGDELFGRSISLDGDRVLVSGEETAYLFQLLSGMSADVTHLNPANLQPGSNFGVSVSLDANRALVGADFHDQPGIEDSGAAYVFDFDGDEWVETDMLAPEDAKEFAHFGRSLSLDGGRALIAAPHFDQAPGEAFIFELGAGDRWRQTAKLPVEDFGGAGRSIAVELDVDRAIVGGNGEAAVFFIPEPTTLSHTLIVLVAGTSLSIRTHRKPKRVANQRGQFFSYRWNSSAPLLPS